ncbi:glycosyltransferase family protein [Moorella sulfitireducens]|uniref:glycosyltransferase family protein n=1 Tax=Neomoorella sulfitireducens TaxID=2972948 RepID=UPI0021AC0C41|nr:DNRLRE domain-containing protein [Moorella sulfitireducens]
MRILYLNGHPVWTYGLPWGFRQLGHEVKIVGVIQKDYLTRYMELFHPKLLVTVGWMDEYTFDKLEVIRKLAQDFGCLHAYWATEDINFLERWSLRMVKVVQPDVVFTINADCIPYYRDLGIPAFHLEFGYNPGFEASIPGLPAPGYDHDLALVANCYDIWTNTDSFRYKSMEILVRPLVEKGYDLVLYGKGWEEAPWLADKQRARVHYLGPVSFADTFRIYRRAKIVLNLQNQGQHTTQVTSRTFEITGSGGFQLTTRTPAVEKLFVHRQHLVMSSSPEETLELVDYYLAHEEERQAIAANGRAEILAKHTYDKRAAFILSCLDSIKGKEKASNSKNLHLKLLQPAAADAYVASGDPVNSHRNVAVLAIGRERNRGAGWSTSRAYLFFDLGDFPPDAELDKAILYLWLNWKGTAGDVIQCYPVLQPWQEETISWYNQPAHGGQPVAKVAVEGNANKKWLSWDITALVKKWIDKTIANHGLCLRSLYENVRAATIQTLASSRWTGSKEYKPYLTILYFSSTGDCGS